MSTLLRVNDTIIVLDNVALINLQEIDESGQDAVQICYNDDSTTTITDTNEVAALRWFLTKDDDDIVKLHKEHLERTRQREAIKNDICPDCGSPLGKRGEEHDGECMGECGFTKWD